MSTVLCEHDCTVETSQHGLQRQTVKAQLSEMNDRDNCGDNEKPLHYCTQSEDEYPSKLECSMESRGPWATGQVTCSPKGEITGLRPVADRYSVTRYGPREWRAHNLSIFLKSNEKITDAQIVANSAKQCVDQVYAAANKTQLDTTEHLKQRAHVVYSWKTELEHATADLVEEIELLEGERRRVQRSLSVLTVPESISSEFLQLRSFRLEYDLVRDPVEEQLVKEIALCAEIRHLLNKTYDQINMQMAELKTAKTRLESDWSDKIRTYNIDSICVNLSNDSPVVLWKPGATRLPTDQSTPSSYDDFTREGLTFSETARQTSIDLRITLNITYDKSIKDLRDQATRVDTALAENVKITQECLHQLEKELFRCLRELANTENLIDVLRDSPKGLNNSIKVVQTRMDNRLHRRNVESCRDAAQFALIEEAKSLGEQTSAVLTELRRAEECQAELVKTRDTLEHEIMVKQKTLYIDKERGQLLRSSFPSMTALSGF